MLALYALQMIHKDSQHARDNELGEEVQRRSSDDELCTKDDFWQGAFPSRIHASYTRHLTSEPQGEII